MQEMIYALEPIAKGDSQGILTVALVCPVRVLPGVLIPHPEIDVLREVIAGIRRESESPVIRGKQTVQRVTAHFMYVFEEEPLPPESPLWGLESLLITPHCAGFVENLWEQHLAEIAGNLSRYLAGEPLLGIVDKVRGY